MQHVAPATAIFHENGTYTLGKQSLQHAQCVTIVYFKLLTSTLMVLFVFCFLFFRYSVQSVSFLNFKSLAMKSLRFHFTGEPFKGNLLLASSSIFVVLFRMFF